MMKTISIHLSRSKNGVSKLSSRNVCRGKLLLIQQINKELLHYQRVYKMDATINKLFSYLVNL